MVHPNSMQRRKVLSEEEFSATLTSIVQRDYFPELPELERQAAVLERRSQGDVVGAVAFRRAARQLQQHEDAIAVAETEDEHDLDTRQVRRRARPLHQESITGFHARVTNEDDEEFSSNQKKEIKENRERLEKLFRTPEELNKLTLLTNMASDQFQAEPNRIAAIEWHKPTVRNGLFFNPTPLRDQDDHLVPDAVKLISDQSAGSASVSQLALMPPPAKSVKQSIPKHQMVEYVPKHKITKRIEPSQTRFPNKIIPMPAWRSLIAGSELESETDGSVTDASTDLDAPLRPVDHERRRRQQERNHQSYVTMTPLIVPGMMGNESPIMTWGTVDSTPLLLSGRESEDQARESSYNLASENERERAARKAEKELARRAKRAKATSSKHDGPKRIKSMSPALTPGTLSLWQKTKLPTPSRAADAFASSLRSSYTPKRQSSASAARASSTRKIGSLDSAFKATPLASRK